MPDRAEKMIRYDGLWRRCSADPRRERGSAALGAGRKVGWAPERRGPPITPLLRRLAACCVLPFTLAAALGGALLAMPHVAQPAWVVPPLFLASILWVAALERWLPYRPEWNRPLAGDRARERALAAQRRSRFRILPVGPCGSPSENSTMRGYL